MSAGLTIGLLIGGVALLIVLRTVVSYVMLKKIEKKNNENSSVVYKFTPNENEDSLDEVIKYHEKKEKEYNEALKQGNKELAEKNKPINYKLETEEEMCQ